MTRPESGCKDCNERQLGCHAYCESYKVFRKELDAYNKEIRKIKSIELSPTHNRPSPSVPAYLKKY